MLTDEEREQVRCHAYAGSYSREKADRYVREVERILTAHVAEAERRGAVRALRDAAAEMEAMDIDALTASVAAPSGVPEGGRQAVIDAASAMLEAPWDWLRDRADRLAEDAGAEG